MIVLCLCNKYTPVWRTVCPCVILSHIDHVPMCDQPYSTLVLTWLGPDTVQHPQASFVPGPPHLAQPSEKQLVRTLENWTPVLKVKIIFWYVLPTSVVGYAICWPIHTGKEKHWADVILSYGSDFGKRIFVPAEKVEINFIILSMFGDSKISHKNVNYLEKKKKKEQWQWHTLT